MNPMNFDMQFAVVIENAGTNYSAYVPDLPGCVAAGDTLQEVKDLIREAIALHIAGLREDGLPIPQPSTHVIDIDVKVA